jgi:small subunit ribosomal protein S25e
MGGVKKKSLASMEKKQDSEASPQESAAGSKGKKAKETKSAPQQKKQLTFIAPKLSDADLLKSLTPLRAITVFSASRVLAVNSSVAAGLLKDLEARSLIAKAGGFSGHRIWAVVQKT